MPAYRLPLALLNLFMLVFAASAVVGLLPAYDSSLSTPALTAILLSILCYFAAAYLTRSWLAVRVVSGVMLVIAALLALYFITQFSYQNYIETPELIQKIARMTTIPFRFGDYIHPNAVATFLEVAVPLGVARALSSRSILGKVFWALCALVIVYAIFLSYSRGAYLALAAVAALVIALLVLSRLPRKVAWIVAIIGVIGLIAGLVAIVVAGPENLPFLASTFSRASDRGRLFVNSLYLGRDYLFTGIGLGNTFSMVYARYSLLIYVPFLSYAHNLPLSVWLNQGLLGLAAFAGIVIAFYALVYRVTRVAEPRRLFHGAWLGVTAGLLHGLVDAPQYADHRWVMPMLFLAMGLTVAAGRLAVEEAEEIYEPRPLPWKRWLAVSAAGVVLVVGAWFIFNRPIMAAWYTNLGVIDETRGELPENMPDAQRQTYYVSAEGWYRRALALNPDDASANRRLGNMLVKFDQFEAAVPLLEASYAEDPADPATVKGLGLAYMWVGRLDEAARLFAGHYDRSEIEEELGNWASFRSDQNRPLLAAYAWETALLMSPESVNVPAWLFIADNYRAADLPDDARRWYNRVLEVEPDNEFARDGLARLG